jgi:hypothetical protein
MLEESEPDILAFYAFSPAHRRRRHLPRRPLVDPARRDALHRTNDEWLVGRGYLSAESISMCLAGPAEHTDEIKEEMPELQAT